MKEVLTKREMVFESPAGVRGGLDPRFVASGVVIVAGVNSVGVACFESDGGVVDLRS